MEESLVSQQELCGIGKVYYYLLRGEHIVEDCGGIIEYGIKIILSSPKQEEEKAVFPYISSSKQFVSGLLNQIIKRLVLPISLENIIEDALY